MRIRVLSAGGSVGPQSDASCFLLGDGLLLDAGSAASTLNFEEQLKVRSILLTHAHLDHVKDIPFLCENAFGRINHTLVVHGESETLARLKRHVFNGELWPDFTTLPGDSPVLTLQEFRAGEWFDLEGLKVFAITMPHPGGSVGFLLDSGDGVIAISGDTGPGSPFSDHLGESAPRLRGVLMECSFPDRLEDLAVQSGHLCPRLLREELEKIPGVDTPIHIYGLKAPTREETISEIETWADGRLEILEAGRVLEF